MRVREVFTGTPAEKEARRKVKALKKIEKRNSRQDAALNQAQDLSKRLFLRQSAAGALGLGLSIPIVNFFIPNEETHTEVDNLPPWLTIEGNDIIGEERVGQAINAAKEWAEKYGVERKIKISPLLAQDREVLSRGQIATVVERAGAGYIHLGPTNLIGETRNITLHAMTHAIRPDNPNLFPEPLQISIGTLRGVHGLNILATDKNGVLRDENGVEMGFTLFEEAMAVRNASAFPGYSETDPRFIAIGSLARQHIPLERYSHAHLWNKTNDFFSFARAALGISENAQITGKHIEILINQYQTAWDLAS